MCLKFVEKCYVHCFVSLPLCDNITVAVSPSYSSCCLLLTNHLNTNQLPMKKVLRSTLSAILISFIATMPLLAQQLYYADVLSIFSTYNCTSCHGGTSGLNVNTYASLLAGGNNCGAAILPFNANGSPIVTKIDPAIPNCTGGNMPQGGGTVSAAHIATIKQWINSGALQSASSDCADLTISAYVEGSNDNKYLEIYNGTGAARNLSGYSVRLYNNGSATPVGNIALSGTLAADDYYLIANNDANLPGLTPDITSGTLNFNGNDAVALYNGTTNIDVFGQIGFNPGDDGWASDTCTTKDHTWVKINNSTSCIYGNFLGDSDFNGTLGTLYACQGQNDVTNLHTFVPSTASCPELVPAPDTPDLIIVCSDSALDLSVVLTGDPNAQVLWYESGVVIGSGTTIANILQNNDCNNQLLSITATAANANPDCAPVSVNFVVNLLPNPDTEATVVSTSECEVCLMTPCFGITSYAVNGGAAIEGSCYSAVAGENSNILFTIANQCGLQAYPATVSCPNNANIAQISGFVWIDNNADLAYNSGEITPNGVQVGLFDATTSLQVGSTISTNFNGEYEFNDLAAGTYFLAFNAPGILGFPVVGAGANGLTTPFDLAIGQSYDLNVGYIIEVGVETIGNSAASLVIAQIAPQPAHNNLDVVFYSTYSDVTQIQIYDLAGRKRYQTAFDTHSGANTLHLDLNNYVAGMYVLSLQNSHTRLTTKISLH